MWNIDPNIVWAEMVHQAVADTKCTSFFHAGDVVIVKHLSSQRISHLKQISETAIFCSMRELNSFW